MKYILLILVLLFNINLTLAQNKSAKKDVQWNTFDAGLAQAKKSGKKILVDVYTDWCGWCKKMDANTYSDAKVQDYLKKNFVIVKLNAEANEKITYTGQTMSPMEFSRGMGVNGYPATLFLQSDGKPITVLPGYSEPDMFIHVLSFIGEDQYQKKKFEEYLAEKGVKQ